MIFIQHDQVIGVKEPSKSQARRVKFPYELARQLWKHGWSYYAEAPWTWEEWRRDFQVTDAQIAEANRILAEHVITLPVQPKRGKKAVGRIRVLRIRRERLGDISEADCLAEGIPSWFEKVVDIHDTSPCLNPYEIRVSICPICEEVFLRDIRQAFACLWDCCGGNWERDKDSDVWVLEFEKVESGPAPKGEEGGQRTA